MVENPVHAKRCIALKETKSSRLLEAIRASDWARVLKLVTAGEEHSTTHCHGHGWGRLNTADHRHENLCCGQHSTKATKDRVMVPEIRPFHNADYEPNVARCQTVANIVYKNPDLDVCDGELVTPLQMALAHRAPASVVRYLITGYNINRRDADGYAPLDYVINHAFEFSKLDAVIVLLQHGARWCVNLQNTLYFLFDILFYSYSTHSNVSYDILKTIFQHVDRLKNINFYIDTSTRACFKVRTSVHASYGVYFNSANAQVIPEIEYFLHVLSHFSILFMERSRVDSDCVISKSINTIMQDLVPYTLKKLCMIAIRSQLKERSTSSFESLGLPRTLIDYVKLAALAEYVVEENVKEPWTPPR